MVVGGWVPDLLLPTASEPHVMSIDVDLALDSRKLTDGRYADLLNMLLDTRRYERSEKAFQFLTIVDLADGQAPIRVDIDFLAPTEFKLRSTSTKRIEGFRVQQADGCGAAFRAPETITIDGRMTRGARIEVDLRVAALPDFLVMKSYALHGRDKPKDAYDICYCLDYVGDGGAAIAAIWQALATDEDVVASLNILRAMFGSVDHFGPRQVVEFHQSGDAEVRAGQAQRAYQLVQRFLQFFHLFRCLLGVVFKPAYDTARNRAIVWQPGRNSRKSKSYSGGWLGRCHLIRNRKFWSFSIIHCSERRLPGTHVRQWILGSGRREGTLLSSTDGMTWTKRFSGDSLSTLSASTLLSATFSSTLQRFVVTRTGGTILVSKQVLFALVILDDEEFRDGFRQGLSRHGFAIVR